jgi:predicted helicase
MPAPFVVAHMQAGLALAAMNAPLPEDARPAIYLTNALTGWEPHTNKPLPYPELEQERASADKVKQASPILVILGNPPYDGFAGISDNAEERALSSEYRKVKKVAPPQGQGLNELYVRFFRMAERRIVEKTGEGIVAFISNYSWLDGLSFPGMRERFLDAFDSIAIDCLNGDKYKTGKTTPEGLPDPSIFSTSANPMGIQVGTAIATMVRKKEHAPAAFVAFRHVWGTAKRATLLNTMDDAAAVLYESVIPTLPMRLQFAPSEVGDGYLGWPRLPELLPVSYAGVKTSRDEFLVDIDKSALEARIERLLDPKVGDQDIVESYPTVMAASARYNPLATRKELIERKFQLGQIVRYAYRPFDVRWAYWDPDTKLLDEKRPEFFANTEFENRFLTAGERNRMGIFYKPQAISVLGDHHLVESKVAIFPATVRQDSKSLEPNVAKSVKEALVTMGLTSGHLFHHILATLNAPSYETANIDALRVDWPRVPFPGDRDVFAGSAQLGEALANLLDSEVVVEGVTQGALLPGLAVIAGWCPRWWCSWVLRWSP